MRGSPLYAKARRGVPLTASAARRYARWLQDYDAERIFIFPFVHYTQRYICKRHAANLTAARASRLQYKNALAAARCVHRVHSCVRVRLLRSFVSRPSTPKREAEKVGQQQRYGAPRVRAVSLE